MDSPARDEKGSDHSYTAQPELESDPRISEASSFRWSKRQILATVSLSILWVGKFYLSTLQASTHKLPRITSTFIFHWWSAVLHGG
jgi:hypothetical protein